MTQATNRSHRPSLFSFVLAALIVPFAAGIASAAKGDFSQPVRRSPSRRRPRSFRALRRPPRRRS